MNPRYRADDLTTFAAALLGAAGLDADKSGVVAEVLLEGDLLGHTTHGLALLAPYLGEIEKGAMEKSGEPRVLADFPAALTWDGRRLPGPWLVDRALKEAAVRARRMGTCTVVIRRSHHIGCLAAYLKRITDQGLMVILSCSDPAVAFVAPHGGRSGVMTPNPLAAGWPTAADPVMLDVSMSITTHGRVRRLKEEKRQAPGDWFVGPDGYATADPSVVLGNPAGALLPMGGVDHGHKGYALGLLVEALTGGLAGHGRAEPAEGWGATVYLQVMDPALFVGTEDFLRETTHLASACRAVEPRVEAEPVRLPGEAGLRKRAAQLATGVALYSSILPALRPWAERWGVQLPEEIGPDAQSAAEQRQE